MENIIEIDDAGNEYEASGFIRNNLAGLIDALLYFLFIFLILNGKIPVPRFFLNPHYGIAAFGILPGFLVYRIVNVLFMSATMGMRIVGIKLMKEDGIALSTMERILAGCMVYINDIHPYKKSKHSS